MAIYDLYEIKSSSLEEAKTIAERVGITLEERESGYHRGPYFACGEMGEENFELKINVDPYEDLPNEEEFPNSKILFYVNNTTRSDELREALLSFGTVVLLRHEDI